jgi:hypothetical protein
MHTQPAGFQCEECGRLARALRIAWRADNRVLRTRLRDVAVSSGRDIRQLGIGWVFSVATMPDEEMRVVLESHYPRVADATRKREAHETASGHSLKGWWMLFHYGLEDSE